jgi:hypothetical protein
VETLYFYVYSRKIMVSENVDTEFIQDSILDLVSKDQNSTVVARLVSPPNYHTLCFRGIETSSLEIISCSTSIVVE